MNTFNSVMSSVFDLVLGWFGHASAWIDIFLWSLIIGVIALIIYKAISNQDGIKKVKNDIKVHILEIRLFQEDLLGVLAATFKNVGKTAIYLGHNILPVLVMLVPAMVIIIQLVTHYGFDPVEPGTTQVLTVKLDAEHTDAVATDVALDVPDGVIVTAGPARIVSTGEVAWNIRADAPGDHVLGIRVGDQVVEKGLAAGGGPRKIPIMRTKSWGDALLYPGEAPLPADSPVYDVRLSGYPTRDLGWSVLGGGELGIMLTVLIVSLVAGIALKGVFGVTL